MRSLEVMNYRFSGYSLLTRDWLLRYSEQHPLLPNLRSLTLTIRGNWISSEGSLLHWLLMFLSPSLTSFRAPHFHLRSLSLMARNVSVCVYGALSKRCANIQTVEMYPTNDDTLSAEDQAIFNRLVDSSVYMDVRRLFMASFHSLTHLATSVVVANRTGLDVFGRLPKLQRLDLYFSGVEPGKVKAAELDPEAFSSLEALSLWNIGCMEDFAIFWAQAPLTHKLKTARVDFEKLAWKRNEDITLLGEVATLLCEHSPFVTNLRLQVPRPRDSIETLAAALREVSKLPLENLEIVAPAEHLEFHQALSPGLFPHVRQLSLPYEAVEGANLSFYAKGFPSLQVLNAYFSNFNIPADFKEGVLGRSGAMTIRCLMLSQKEEGESSPSDAMVAKLVLSLKTFCVSDH